MYQYINTELLLREREVGNTLGMVALLHVSRVDDAHVGMRSPVQPPYCHAVKLTVRLLTVRLLTVRLLTVRLLTVRLLTVRLLPLRLLTARLLLSLF